MRARVSTFGGQEKFDAACKIGFPYRVSRNASLNALGLSCELIVPFFASLLGLDEIDGL